MVDRSTTPLIETPAFLLARVDYGEADLIVHLLTERFGHITSLARGARRSRKRYAGALEPMHTLQVTVAPSARSEFIPLRDAVLLRPRLRLTAGLSELQAAGRALRWMRRAAPPKTPEVDAFLALEDFLDELDQHVGRQDVEAKLAAFGLRMLTAFGWGLQLSACVACGRACPPERAAYVSPERGGLVCRSCGGGPLKLSRDSRASMLAATTKVASFPEFSEVKQVLKIVERALSAHLGFLPDGRG